MVLLNSKEIEEKDDSEDESDREEIKFKVNQYLIMKKQIDAWNGFKVIQWKLPWCPSWIYSDERQIARISCASMLD